MAGVRILPYEPDYDVIPQAIIWRPLRFFTNLIRSGTDQLDEYVGASFIIGNDVRFDLRTYAGHPKLTVTLYLPDGIEDQTEISRVIKIVIREIAMPKHALAWQRGDPFKFGELARPRGDKLGESEAGILWLKIASLRPDRTALTEEIKAEARSYREMSPADLVPSTTRKREAMWQQIIGNVISHQNTQIGVFKRGLAVRIKDGLRVTDRGMDHLKSIGFLPTSATLDEYRAL
jgi:hypothetical protein